MSTLTTRIMGIRAVVTVDENGAHGRFFSPMGDDVMLLPYDLRSTYANAEGSVSTVLMALVSEAASYFAGQGTITDAEDRALEALYEGRAEDPYRDGHYHNANGKSGIDAEYVACNDLTHCPAYCNCSIGKCSAKKILPWPLAYRTRIIGDSIYRYV